MYWEYSLNFTIKFRLMVYSWCGKKKATVRLEVMFINRNRVVQKRTIHS